MINAERGKKRGFILQILFTCASHCAEDLKDLRATRCTALSVKDNIFPVFFCEKSHEMST